MKRTHTCGELNKSHNKQTVTLQGWVEKRRDHGGLVFIDLRDRYGITQLVFDPENNGAIIAISKELKPEFVIEVNGQIRTRPDGMINENMKTGEIEVLILECNRLIKSDLNVNHSHILYFRCVHSLYAWRVVRKNSEKTNGLACYSFLAWIYM